jgi:2,4-dienoyl-CoA reductase-like NADH-dependent reductase (Old Yellow Enzyme family)
MSVALFQELRLREVTLPNRIVISPMQQYMAGRDGYPRDWHFVHLAKMAVGGAGTVFTEALAIEPDGRVTYHDLGVWDDAHVDGLKRLVEGIAGHGAVPATQLIHAGRKASVAPPYHGFEPLGESDRRDRSEAPWPVVSASALEANPGWPTPRALSRGEIGQILERFAAGARRAREAGFRVLDVHGAHGYLIHCFLSQLSNQREDEYGGDLGGRMRFALEVADAVRSEWPSELPLFYRLSCIDDAAGGWTLEDSVALSRELKARGVDVIDCSSGGLGRRTTPLIIPREPGYQVPYAARIRRDTGIATMAVGLIMDPHHANDIVQSGDADLVAIGREALNNPNWGLHAKVALLGDDAYEAGWPKAYGWWLERRAKALEASRRAKAS